MATRTTTDLAHRVLDELGVTGAGESYDADDVALVKARYADRFEQLEDDDIAYWPETVIPRGAMEGLTLVMADICAPAFGYPRDPNREALGMVKLREHTAIPYDGESVEAEYY